MKAPVHFGCAIGFCILILGCSNNSSQVNSSAENVRQIAVLCGQYQGSHKGKTPANLDELKAFAKSKQAREDSLFISPRDNEPYVLVANAKASMPGVGQKAILVHEKTGVNGKRFVAYTTSEIEELDEKAFNAALSAGK